MNYNYHTALVTSGGRPYLNYSVKKILEIHYLDNDM